MSILFILFVLVVVGVILFLVQTYVPMPPPYKKAVIVIAIILMVIWVLQVTGMFGRLGAGPRVG